jgi:lipopolysaccharide transport system permease protein
MSADLTALNLSDRELAPVAHAPAIKIRPPRGWQLINARELWQYRELLYFLTWRDVKVRYKQTVLGAAWAVLQPALMMVVFTIFFSRMAHVDSGGWPYPLFAFAGLLPWTFFSTAIASAGQSVVGSERLITKIYFPRLAIPFASVGAALVDFVVAFGMLAALMVWYRVPPTWNLLWVPATVLLLSLAATGVGTLLAALNVAYRDFRYVIPFLVQVWMFATPTVYMQPNTGIATSSAGTPVAETVSAEARAAHPSAAATSGAQADGGSWRALLNLNPLTGIVAFFRASVLGGPLPWSMFWWSAVEVFAVCLIGCFYFRRVEDSFADII